MKKFMKALSLPFKGLHKLTSMISATAIVLLLLMLIVAILTAILTAIVSIITFVVLTATVLILMSVVGTFLKMIINMFDSEYDEDTVLKKVITAFKEADKA